MSEDLVYCGILEICKKKALEMGYCLYSAPLGNLEEGSFSRDIEGQYKSFR